MSSLWSIRAAALATAVTVVLTSRSAAQDVPASRLRAAIQAAIAQNPEVASMEARIEASRQRVLQADALPDPELELGFKDVPVSNPSLTRDDFTMEMIAARQRFPGSGKRDNEERVAQAELEGMRADHTRHVLEIAADVADSFFRLGELDRRIAIAHETRSRLSDAVTAARERYQVGKGIQADVLRANLEKTALDDRLASLGAARRSEAARFNALQNLPADAPVEPIELPAEVEARLTTRPVGGSKELAGEAQSKSPAVASAAAQVQRAEEVLAQGKLERRPDWMLSGYYGHRVNFEDLFGVSVSFSLPWLHPRRLDERKAERQAELESVRADLAAIRNSLARDIGQAFAELERNRDQARLYRESILPQAEINYRAASEAYAVGAIDFLTYVRSATDLDMYESESAEREAGVGRALAMVQKASGLPLIAGTPTGDDDHAKD
jgi:outer membrane protein TolC